MSHPVELVQNFYFSCGCNGATCCKRSMFPPDRAILLSVTKENDVDFIARFSDAVPAQQIVSRVLHIDDATSLDRRIPASDPAATSIAFVSEPSPGNFGRAWITDTNTAGESLDSNIIEFSLTPLPPTPEPLTAPTLISVTPVTNATLNKGNGKTFGN